MSVLELSEAVQSHQCAAQVCGGKQLPRGSLEVWGSCAFRLVHACVLLIFACACSPQAVSDIFIIPGERDTGLSCNLRKVQV